MNRKFNQWCQQFLIYQQIDQSLLTW
jgi:hypothetical protein